MNSPNNNITTRRWCDLPRDEQVSHYWAAIPDDKTSILDGWDYEIVYVYFDGKWCVYRMGEKTHEPLEAFRFLFRLNLPNLDVFGEQDDSYTDGLGGACGIPWAAILRRHEINSRVEG